MNSSGVRPLIHAQITAFLPGRLFPALLLAPLILGIVYKGGLSYLLLCALVLGAAAVEYAALMARLGWQLSLPLLAGAVLVQVVTTGVDPSMVAPALLAALLAVRLHALYVYERNPGGAALVEWLAESAGVLLLGWLGGYLLRLRQLPDAAAPWTLLAVGSIWIADAAAFCVGTWIGRRRLAPNLSPKKTVEGYAAGVVLGAVLTGFAGSLLGLSWEQASIVGLLIGSLAPVGDLGVSLIKRVAGVKQSGSLFAAHGGVLDRLDSFLWSAPIAYYAILSFKAARRGP